jgi:hypothetical protein
MGRSFDFQPTDPREVERLGKTSASAGRPRPPELQLLAEASLGRAARAREVVEEPERDGGDQQPASLTRPWSQ